ncbi:MAG: ATP-dependent RNA helicase RhlB [Gammaproteobacteria bacterium]|nr:ATP-dependent RNA helicase RhlB [Gammaproteobacteria bacterium]
MQKTDDSDHQVVTETSPESSDTQNSPVLPDGETSPDNLQVSGPADAQPDNTALPQEIDSDAALAADVEAMVAEASDEKPELQEEHAEQAIENIIKASAVKVPFSTFNLEPPLERAIADLGFEFCTPIQAQSLRYTLRGYDVTGKAQTGTGKTAAFLITIINDLLKNPMQDTRYIGEPRAIVLAPTRELVIQIANDAANLTKHTDLHVVTLVGGEDYQKQLRQVDKRPVDIVVATPGRLIDFLQQDHLYLGLVELLVIDEADRMLDMGFIPQVRTIVSRTPHKDCRQTLLFSATFTPEIIELTSRWAMDPVMIEIQPERVATDNVEQLVYLVTTEDKYKLLYNLIAAEGADRVIVFNNRRDQVRKLADNLYRHGVSCGLLSGEIAQNKRVRTLEEFRDGTIKVLVATDVAGRGLHIDDVTHVINYSLPEEADDYVHRIGRTGRAGSVGTSISFACEEDSFLLPNIEKTLGQKLPCVYPDASLLADPPPFSRPTHFKDESKPARGGSSKSGHGRSGGGKPRPRR